MNGMTLLSIGVALIISVVILYVRVSLEVIRRRKQDEEDTNN